MERERPPSITYEEAFFAQGSSTMTGLEPYFEAEALCFHEAGHAVIGLFLGFGATRVAVSIICQAMQDGGLGHSFGGQWNSAKRIVERGKRQIERRHYGWAALAEAGFGGMAIKAGRAALPV